MEIDRKAFRSLTSGLYIISSIDADGRLCGCVVNTLLQVASDPAQLLVSINKQNATAEAVSTSKRFCASVLSQDTTMDLIGTFGFKSSKDIDKFSEFDHSVCESASPVSRTTRLPRSRCASIPRLTWEPTSSSSAPSRMPRSWARDAHHLRLLPSRAARQDAQEGGLVQRRRRPGKGRDHRGRGDGGLGAEGRVALQDVRLYRRGLPDGLPEDWRCPLCGAGRDYFEKVLI